jgi:diketogulonate reductase-like aldo/keto reductase
MENFVLNNGVIMPKIGLGVYQIKNKDEVEDLSIQTTRFTCG